MLKTRYLNISEQLEDRIKSGTYSDKLPNVFALAKSFNADPRTISKAVKALQQKGLVTIRGTRGTFVANMNPTRHKYWTIGIVGFLYNRSCDQELMAMEQTANKAKYDVISIGQTQTRLFTDPHALSNLPVDGLVFTNSTLTPQIVANLREAGIPFVSTNRIEAVQGVNWVDFDHEQGLTDALQHLINLGHKRIAYVAFKPLLEEYRQKVHSAYKRMMESGGIYDESLFVAQQNEKELLEEVGPDYVAVYANRIAKELTQRSNPPTAAYVFGIDLARAITNELKDMGYYLPSDFSVISSTKFEMQARQEPFLSSLVCPVAMRAKMVMDTLTSIIDCPARSITQSLLPTELILKNSTVAPSSLLT